MQMNFIRHIIFIKIAEKTVAEKVSLRLALKQGLVGPKNVVKTHTHHLKGNQVNIPELD